MRKIRRGFPNIRIANRESIILEYGDVSNCSNAYYSTRPNEIVFNNDKFQTEEYCINCLIHELNHWAQFMYLDRQEMEDIYDAYEDIVHDNTAPFVEWINPIRGFYKFKIWEDKYGHKDFVFDLENEEIIGRPKTVQSLIPWIYKHKRKENRW